ncbi:uncharacterized protein LOC124134713 isoform X1 [Haliotis rufescens]|uniref:uncharacterized protein LOC124134713 isoform X1 n=1 Tax=Haliotis rufescens TaxID=6454 RepID=UPI001EB03F7E|nr:uncharacterized protein LOC124134713 isoform X1 [Haliotis rufescens]
MKLMGFPGDAFAKLDRKPKTMKKDLSCSFKEVHLPPITDKRKVGRRGRQKPKTVIRKRLMERPNLDARKGKRPPWAADGKPHHEEYLKRLTRLRDQLVDQEQTNLAQALDRLRIRQISKEDANFRLRLKDSGTNLYSPRRRAMITTLEKFKKMRPQKNPPTLCPLEGKQLIEPKNSDTPRMFLPEGSDDISVPVSSRVEQTVQLNLQRLAQPISSIPNIGRKALKREDLVLHSHGMEKRTPKNPMLKHTHALSQGTALTPLNRARHINAFPDSFKLEPLTEGDQIDMDKLRKYYYVYYLPSTSASQDGDRSVPKTPKNTVRQRRVHSYRDCEKSVVSSIVSVIDDEGYSTNGKTSLPYIESTGSGTLHWHDHPRFPEDVDINSVGTAHDPDYITGRTSRVHIVVDMPDIIYSAPTPDVIEGMEMKKGGSLSKTYKQNEIRQRELHNLIEDVKELNMRTETLTSELFH